MIKYKIKSNSGFLALISAIIISVVLLLIASNSSFTGFYTRSNVLDFELKERSYALAEACVNIAILKLLNNTPYVGGEIINISGSDFCTINTINPNLDPIIIQTKAIFEHATTNLNIKVNKTDLSIISWEEI